MPQNRLPFEGAGTSGRKYVFADVLLQLHPPSYGFEVWQGDSNSGHAGWFGLKEVELQGSIHKPRGSLFIRCDCGFGLAGKWTRKAEMNTLTTVA